VELSRAKLKQGLEPGGEHNTDQCAFGDTQSFATDSSGCACSAWPFSNQAVNAEQFVPENNPMAVFAFQAQFS